MSHGRPMMNLLLGRFFSAMGIQLFLLSGVYGVFQQTKSYLLAGLTGLALFVPNLLMVFLAGHGTDKVRRVGVLYVLCQILFLLVTTVMLFPAPSPALVFVLFTAASALRALRTPAYYALTKWQARPEAAGSIARWMTVSWQLPMILGPALFSFVQDFGGHGALSALTLAFMLGAVVVSLPFWKSTRPCAESSRRKTEPSMMNETVPVEAARKRWLRASFADFMITGLSSFAILLPFLLGKAGEDPSRLGYLRAALSAGSLICVSTFGRSASRMADDRVFGSALAGGVLITLAVSFAPSFELFLGLCLMFGFLDGISILHREALQLAACTDHNAGKTAALSQIFNSASDDLGDFRAGIAAEWWGPARALHASAALALAVCAGFWGRKASQSSTFRGFSPRLDSRIGSKS